MSRITAPAVRLAQTIGSAPATPSVFRASGSVLSPKYADLLRTRTSAVRDHPEARTLTTTQNPLRLPLSAQPSPPSGLPIDAALLPNLSTPTGPDAIRVPILPDNFSTARAAPTASASAAAASAIVAAHPEHVAPASMLTSVSGLGGASDGVDLRFAHRDASTGSKAGESVSTLRNIWEGLVRDVLPKDKVAL